MSKIVREGWAFKQGKVITNFKKRYLTLFNDGKVYYNAKPGERYKGGIALSAKSQVASPGECITRSEWPNNPPIWSKDVMLDNAFAILTPTRNYFFYCEDAADTSAWVQVLREIQSKVAAANPDTTEVLPFDADEGEAEDEVPEQPKRKNSASGTPKRSSSFLRRLSIGRRNSKDGDSSSSSSPSKQVPAEDLKKPNLEAIPRLSNEKQLEILTLVKSGMSIDDALKAAQNEFDTDQARDQSSSLEDKFQHAIDEAQAAKKKTEPVLVKAKLAEPGILHASVESPFKKVPGVCQFMTESNTLFIHYGMNVKGNQIDVTSKHDFNKNCSLLQSTSVISHDPVDYQGINYAGTLTVKHADGRECTAYIPGVRTYDPAGLTGDEVANESLSRDAAQIMTVFSAVAIVALRHGATEAKIKQIQEDFAPLINDALGRGMLADYMARQLCEVYLEKKPQSTPYASFLAIMNRVGRLELNVAPRDHCRQFLESFSKGQPLPPQHYYHVVCQEDDPKDFADESMIGEVLRRAGHFEGSEVDESSMYDNVSYNTRGASIIEESVEEEEASDNQANTVTAFEEESDSDEDESVTHDDEPKPSELPETIQEEPGEALTASSEVPEQGSEANGDDTLPETTNDAKETNDVDEDEVDDEPEKLPSDDSQTVPTQEEDNDLQVEDGEDGEDVQDQGDGNTETDPDDENEVDQDSTVEVVPESDAQDEEQVKEDGSNDVQTGSEEATDEVKPQETTFPADKDETAA